MSTKDKAAGTHPKRVLSPHEIKLIARAVADELEARAEEAERKRLARVQPSPPYHEDWSAKKARAAEDNLLGGGGG